MKVYHKERVQKLRYEALMHYSEGIPHCATCGVEDVDVLCFDHIDGLKEEGRLEGLKLYKWLKDESYPKGFQVLCANCNMKKEAERLRVESSIS